MFPKPLEIDLRGKGFFRVLFWLWWYGFTLKTGDATRMWDDRESSLKGRATTGTRVRIIWIKNEEAHLLTVINFKGRRVTLESGMDLHLFDRPGLISRILGLRDWSPITTMNVMR